MKTKQQIKKEIDNLIQQGLNLKNLSEDEEKKECSRIVSRIKYLRPFLNYLEKEPTEQFLKSELEKAEKKMKAINERWQPPQGCSHQVVSELRKSFNVEFGVSRIQSHIKNLKFILS